MTEPNCEYCDLLFSRCPKQSVTRIWKCGTWSNHESGQGEQGIICREKELVRKVDRLEAVVQWAFVQRGSAVELAHDLGGEQPWLYWGYKGAMPDEVRQTILDTLKAAEAAEGKRAF